MAKKSADFKDFLLEQLKDPQFAAAYLNEHYRYQGPKRRAHLFEAFKNVVQAQGVTELSRRSGISRRTLYKAFSETGNPTVETLFTLLETIGVGIHFNVEQGSKRKAVAKQAVV